MKILLDHSRILIRTKSGGRLEKLKKMLGVWDPVTFSYSMVAVKDLGKDLYAIPKNVNFKKVKDLYFDYTLFETTLKNYQELSLTTFPKIKEGYGLRDSLQASAYSYLLEAIKNDSQMMLNMRTGSGKTFLAIKFLCDLKLQSLIIVDKVDLMTQWKEKFLEYTDGDETDIEIITGSDKMNDLVVNGTSAKVVLTTYRSLQNAVEKDVRFFTRLLEKTPFSLKIFDEAHKELNTLFTIDMSSDFPYTLYLTATPGRSNFRENKILNFLLPFDTSFGKDIIKKKYHNVLFVSFDSNPKEDVREIIEEKNRRGFDVNKYCEHIMDSGWEQFSTLILTVLKDAYKDNFKKTFILFKKLDMITRMKLDLEEFIKEQNLNIEIGTFTGQVPKAKREAEKNKDLVLCTEKIFQSGIDVDGIEILINTFPMSSPILTEQIIGRIRDNENETLFVDLVDLGFKQARRQQSSRERVYRKLAKDIRRVTL